MNNKKINLIPLRYLDVSKGKYIYDANILINGRYIEKVSENIVGYKNILLDNVTLLPGLIDTHVHITYCFPGEKNGIKKNQKKTLEAGFTTVRDLGSEKIIEVKDKDFSPTILWSGKPIFKKDLEEKSIEDNLKLRSHSDAIKIFESKHNPIELKDLKKIINLSSIPVAIHAIYPEEVEIASLSGCRSIEHCSYIDKFHYNNETYVCPTFSNPSQYLDNFDNYRFMFGERYNESRNYFQDIKQNNIQNVSKIYPKARLVFGTDSVAGMHGNNQYEFSFLEKLGMSNLEMIRLATITASEMLGMPEIGEIDRNCHADIIGVIGDPLKNIDDLLNIVFVMKNGITFINEML